MRVCWVNSKAHAVKRITLCAAIVGVGDFARAKASCRFGHASNYPPRRKYRRSGYPLTPDELAQIDRLFPQKGAVVGARHDYDRLVDAVCGRGQLSALGCETPCLT